MHTCILPTRKPFQFLFKLEANADTDIAGADTAGADTAGAGTAGAGTAWATERTEDRGGRVALYRSRHADVLCSNDVAHRMTSSKVPLVLGITRRSSAPRVVGRRQLCSAC